MNKKNKTNHPKMYTTKVLYTNGESNTIITTKELDTIKMEIDRHNHPAWNKKASKTEGAGVGRVQKYMKAFGEEEDLL